MNLLYDINCLRILIKAPSIDCCNNYQNSLKIFPTIIAEDSENVKKTKLSNCFEIITNSCKFDNRNLTDLSYQAVCRFKCLSVLNLSL